MPRFGKRGDITISVLSIIKNYVFIEAKGIVLWYGQVDFVIVKCPLAARHARALSRLRTVFSTAGLFSSITAIGASRPGPRLAE